MSPSVADTVEIVNMKHIKTRLVAVAALVIATGVIATKLALAQGAPVNLFTVGVYNSTTTPEVALSNAGPRTPAGQLEVECGTVVWRTLPWSKAIQYFSCYPSTATGSFNLTYKARLANDADGNAVYHSGTVAISCTRGSDDPAVPNDIGANVRFTGGGTGITASNVICEQPQSQQQPSGD